jgi:hypothetical protein
MLALDKKRRGPKIEDAAGNPRRIAGGIRCKQWDLPNNGGHNSTLRESVVNSGIRTRKSLFPMRADYVIAAVSCDFGRTVFCSTRRFPLSDLTGGTLDSCLRGNDDRAAVHSGYP